VLVLAGSIEVRTRIQDFGRERVELVEAGGLINVLALLGDDPGTYGETVVAAEVSSPALLVTLSSGAFASSFEMLEGSNPTDEIRRVAETRKRMLKRSALQALLPEVSEAQLELIATGAQTQVLVNRDDELLLSRSQVDHSTPMTSEAPDNAVHSQAIAVATTVVDAAAVGVRRSAKIRDEPPQDRPALQDTMFVLLKGLLSADSPDGQAMILGEGSTLATPLPITVADSVSVVIAARASLPQSIVLRLELLSVTEEGRMFEAGLLEERNERDRVKTECERIRKKINEAEFRLGINMRRPPRRLWRWAISKLRILRAFDMEPSAEGQLKADGGSLAEELVSLQQRLIALDQLVFERESALRKAILHWRQLQPPFLPEEDTLVLDVDQYDLSAARVNAAEATVAQVEFLRNGHRAKMVEELERLWARTEVPPDKQQLILESAPGITTRSLQILADEQQKSGMILAKPMLTVQARLNELWDELHVPDTLRLPYQWKPGSPIYEETLSACQAEVERLESWHTLVVKQGVLESEASARTVGIMLAAMRDAPALAQPDGATTGDAQVRRATSADTFGYEEATEAARRTSELEEKLEKLEREMRKQQEEMRKQQDEMRKQQEEMRKQQEEMRKQQEEMRKQESATEQDRAAAAVALEAEANRAAKAEQERQDAIVERQEADQRSAEELARRDAEETARVAALESRIAEEAAKREEVERLRDAQIKKATANSEMRRNMELAAHRFTEERLIGTKKEQTEDTLEFEALLTERRALISKVVDLMRMLSCAPSISESFHERYNRSLANPSQANDNDIREVKIELEELNKSVERLEMRVDSDALFVALRNIMSANVWKPKVLGQMIVKGPGALKIEGQAESEIALPQLDHFLQRKEIRYTTNGLEFFLTKCGTSTKKMDKGGKIDVEKMVKAFDTVTTPPLQV